MANTLGIGVGALLAFQRSLGTIGQNIANVNTEGYSRQRVELSTRVPDFTGNGFVGNGVQVSDIRRVVDDFVIGQLRSSSSAFNQFEAFNDFASRVDDLLADPLSGITPVLQNFFAALQDVANDPTSNPSRQVLLNEAETLAQRFQYLDARFSELRTAVNVDLENITAEISSLASAIADINGDIVAVTRSDGTNPPNDLLDQRDRLIQSLAEHVDVTTLVQDDGALNVSIGNGQALVIGTTAGSLTTVVDPFDATRFGLGISLASATVDVTAQLTGGRIAGLLDFRNNMLDSTQNALGRVALGLVTEVNAQHRLGLDLTGALGGDFFSIGGIAVAPNATNSGGAVSAALVDVSNLTTSDYRLRYEGSDQYTLTRLSDGQTSNIDTMGASPFTTAEVDGFTLTITTGTAAVGDSFLVRPTAPAAGTIGVAVSEAARIAAAAPVRAVVANANGGDGSISGVAVANTTNIPLPADVTLTFSADADGGGNPGFIVAGGPASPVLYDPATESSGKTITLAGFGDITFTFAGVPSPGDTFTISNNIDGVGDNRNALSLVALQTASLLRGNNTLQSAYTQLVADVGIRTRQSEITRDAQAVIFEQAQERRAASSGVNLEEEAANLLRFQQSFQAAARVISVADELFQELLGAIR